MADERFNRALAGVDLQQLPQFTPPASLWLRIETAWRRRLVTRRWQAGSIVAVAAVAALVVLLPRALPIAQSDVAQGQRESQALEREWQQLARSGSGTTAASIRLRAIDGALQSAYDRGAQGNELAPLWRERNEALRGLITGFEDKDSHAALTLTRI